ILRAHLIGGGAWPRPAAACCRWSSLPRRTTGPKTLGRWAFGDRAKQTQPLGNPGLWPLQPPSCSWSDQDITRIEEAAMNTAAFVAAADRLAGAGWAHFRFGLSPQRVAPIRIYQITDRLHDGRTVRVPGNRIGCTVSAWLAELGVDSPMVN